MKKLTDKEWYVRLQEIKDMAGKSHEECDVQLILADLYYTLSERYIWELPKIIWRSWKIREVVKLHKIDD